MSGVEAVPSAMPPSAGVQPKVKDCKSLLTDRTKAIALVSPNNPVGVQLDPTGLNLLTHLQAGATYAPELLRSFAELAKSRDVTLILN